jgi:hypothetical protein
MDFLDSENAKLIKLDPKLIAFGTSYGANAENALVIFYKV